MTPDPDLSRLLQASETLLEASRRLQDALQPIYRVHGWPIPPGSPAARTGDVVALSPQSDDPLPGEVVRLPTDRCFTCRKLRSEHPGGHFCFPGKGYRTLPPLGQDVSSGPVIRGERPPTASEVNACPGDPGGDLHAWQHRHLVSRLALLTPDPNAPRCYSCGALSAHCVCPSKDPGY
jgi:hypothetical protein